MMLAGFVVRRVASGIVFAFAVASLALLLARLAPGDATTGDWATMSPDQRAARRHELGLDVPLRTQYGRWLQGVAHLDLGQSSLYRRPVAALVGERALNTALLAVVAAVVATLIGIPLGRFSGAHQGALARLVRLLSIATLSMPPLLGVLMLVFLAAYTGWLPVGGMTSARLSGTAWIVDLARHLPVPVLALALPLAATLERVQARSMAEAIGRPFVAASRARGLSRDRTLRVHAWPVSLAPVLGLYGVLVGALFSGSFVVEIVTSWPGLGLLLFDALHGRDVWLTAGCGAAGAVALAAGTTFADVLHAMVDPRVLEGRDA
ncbi:MAG: ABC transporter permease [Acidobacteriota bacterium]